MGHDKNNINLNFNVIKITLRAAALLMFLVPALTYASIWVLVDTKDAVIKIMDGKKPVLTLEDISLGRSGVTDLHIKGDDKTPRGVFSIVRINRDSQFRTFFEINYPTINHAQDAVNKGIIDNKTYTRIKISQQASGKSPRDTVLGGNLGIHGIGAGDPLVHEMFNWTNGCIALTNNQIDQLSQWVHIGTKVVIE